MGTSWLRYCNDTECQMGCRSVTLALLDTLLASLPRLSAALPCMMRYASPAISLVLRAR
jgi:hypothetical protein